MKVAMIGQKGLPATFGGVERHCEEIGSRLAEKGCEVTVFCRPYYSEKTIRETGLEKDSRNTHLYKGMKLRLVPSIPTKHLDAASHSFLCSVKTMFSDYDILHYHALGPTIFSVLPKILNKPVVSTVHGLDWRRGKWGGFAKTVLQKGEKICARYPNALIVVSKTLRDYFRKEYNKSPFYIPNGILPPKHLPPRKINVKWKLEKNSYILFVGRLVPEKGCHYLIEAFKKIETDNPFVLEGGASHSDDYVKKLKKSASGRGRIIFTDYLYEDALKEIYSNAYCYVHPSDLEGLPICLLEAMSYGNCILASDIPENAEVIMPGDGDDYGYLFEQGNVSDLGEKLERILAHPMEARETGEKARLFVKKNFNWDLIAEQTLKVYQNVLDKR